jgi:hypothetical protein
MDIIARFGFGATIALVLLSWFMCRCKNACGAELSFGDYDCGLPAPSATEENPGGLPKVRLR